jgi:nitroreductase
MSLAEKRRSIRKFQQKKVESGDLNALMEAVMLSPSAMNEQPWFFVLIEREEIIHQIEELAEPAGDCHGAPLLMIAYAHNDALEPDTDTVLAIGSVMAACVERGLGSCYIEFVRNVMNCPAYHALNTALGVPDGCHCVGALAVGYPDEEPAVPSDRRSDVFSIIS